MRIREQRLNMPSYILPQDQERLSAEWWTAKEAAAAWGCSYSTAWHIIERHPYDVKMRWVEVVTKRGGRIRHMIPAGTKKPITRGGGNPQIGNKDFQSKAAQKRWK